LTRALIAVYAGGIVLVLPLQRARCDMLLSVLAFPALAISVAFLRISSTTPARRIQWASAALVLLSGCVTPGISGTEELVIAAHRELKDGNHEYALELLTRAIETDPQDDEPYEARAFIYSARMGQHDRAIDDLTRAIALSSQPAWTFGARGDVHRAAGRIPESLADYDKAIELDATNASYFRRRAWVRVMLGDTGGAREDFSRAVQLDPQDGESWGGRGEMLLKTKDHAAAIRDLSRAIQINPQNARHLRSRAIAYQNAGDLKSAILDLSRAAELNPDDARTYHMRASARWARGETPEARDDADRALAIDPARVATHSLRARIRRELGDHAGALADLDHVVRFRPESGAARYMIGLVHFDRGEMPEAIGYLRDALRLGADDFDTRIALAAALQRRDDFRTSLAELAEAVEARPQDPRPFVLRSRAHRRLGNTDLALADEGKADDAYGEDVVASFHFGPDAPGIVIPLIVAGEPVPVFLDTGAPGLMLDASLAHILGTKKATREVGAFESTISIDVHEAPRIQLGRTPIEGIDEVAVLDLTAQSEASHQAFKGIAGLAVVARFVLQIDFERGTVRFLEPSAGEHPEWGSRLPMVECGARACVESTVMGKTRKFMLDTGYNGTGVIDDELFGQLVSNGALPTAEVLGRNLSGDTRRREARITSFRLGPFTHRGLVLGSSPWCILGTDYLSRYVITMDFPYMRLYLRPARQYSRPDESNLTGLCLVRRHDRILVHDVYGDSPAADAGIKAGDVVTHIDGRPVEDMSRLEIFGRETAPPGSQRTYRVLRGDKTFGVELVLRRRL